LVDRVLKKEFDVHRAAQTPHPIMVANGKGARGGCRAEAEKGARGGFDPWRASALARRTGVPQQMLASLGTLMSLGGPRRRGLDALLPTLT
jgi:hypothetical protein